VIKKIVLALLVLFVLGAGALAWWARSVFTGDNIRATLAAQLSEVLGQPVTVGSVAASAYPRVTIDLGDVAIGQPARIQIASLHFGTDFRALLSRRIEHADVRVNTVRVELPLPALGGRSTESPTSPTPSDGGEPPVTLVSVDEVAIRDVTIVSGGRTLKADIEAVPTSAGVTLRRVVIAADDTAIEATGEITDLAGPVGTITVKAGQLDFDRLIAFLGDFASGSGVAANPSAAGVPSPRPTPVNLIVTMEADRAKSGTIVLDKLTGRAVVTDAGVTLDPVAFGIFGGRYQGTLSTSMGSAASADQPPAFKGTAKLSGIDMAALTAFAGTPGTITGRLNGSIDLTGTGSDLAAAMKTVRGMARLDIADGVIRHLQLVRTIVLATSMRKDSTQQALGDNAGGGGEAFKRLASTLSIVGRHAQTNDLQLDSRDVTLTASGRIALDGSAIELTGRVQLSPELSAQAGRDLLRYTADNGRVTLPATVTGSADKISVRIDVADAAKRAVRNRAADEAQKAIERNIGSLFKRKPPG